MPRTEPKPCDYCGRVGTHSTICWAIERTRTTGQCRVAQGSSPGVPDPEASDRAEDSYQNMMMGEGPVGTW